MKIGIIGTRTFKDYEYFTKNVGLFYITEIRTGDASGTDSLARQYAMDNNIPLTVFYADWDKYGKSAGPIRNIELIRSTDMILAFWDGNSPGTRQVIDYCTKHEHPFIVVRTPGSRFSGPEEKIPLTKTTENKS